jgi:hypothetical protein
MGYLVFVSKKAQNRGNSSTYYQKFSAKSIQQKNASKLDEK